MAATYQNVKINVESAKMLLMTFNISFVIVLIPINIKHNKPNMVIWDHIDRQCSIIEFSCPADINIGKKIISVYSTNFLRNFICRLYSLVDNQPILL